MPILLRRVFIIVAACVFVSLAACQPAAKSAASVDPLPSWNDGAAKSAIVDFVARATKQGSPENVPPAERIATFDNDGTLWAEQPAYFQLLFALDRVRAMAPDHPEWQDTEPFKSAIAGDMQGLMATGMKGLEQILLVAHANMSADEFAPSVADCQGGFLP